jgi:hypothetical protein
MRQFKDYISKEEASDIAFKVTFGWTMLLIVGYFVGRIVVG